MICWARFLWWSMVRAYADARVMLSDVHAERDGLMQHTEPPCEKCNRASRWAAQAGRAVRMQRVAAAQVGGTS